MKALNIDVVFGQNELTNTTGFINQIDSFEIGNGVFQHMNVINSYNPNASDEVPPTWENNFIMDCDFDSPELNAGNIDSLLRGINKILVKRRLAGVYSNIGDGWGTIAEIDINNIDDLQFTIYDYASASNAIYEYTLVPTLIQTQGDIQIEVESSVTKNSVTLQQSSDFKGVFICDLENAYKLDAGISYGSATYNQLTGVHQTLGNKYPIIVNNSVIDYTNGSVSGIILNKDYGKIDPNTGEMVRLDRKGIVEAREEFRKFIMDKSPKILKDWNGNIWLVMITDSPSYDFVSEWGMGLGTISFNWTEIGDANNLEDLYKADMITRR